MKTYLIILLALAFSFLSREAKPAKKITVYTIGDSTMANKKPEVEPETGWGQVLNEYFTDQVVIENHAVNGRSSKSFLTEGRWQVILDKLKPGDYVMIQFGHNDEKEKDSSRYTNPFTQYRENLKKYINETRSKGAFPILLTSIARRNFNENGVLIDTHGNYPEVARKVAAEMNIPLIDLQLMTENMIIQLGPEKSKSMFLHVLPGEYPGYPDGKQDDTHLNKNGAHRVAEMVVNELRKQQLPLSDFLKH